MPFIFLEYEAGGDLNAWIALKNASRDLPEALRLAVGFCDGINYVYSKGIKAHRDIKPGNCLISANGDLKITDFGLASVLVPFDFTSTANRQRTPKAHASVGRLTEVGFILGTIPYMAPEQISDAGNVDARADIYSFGIMLFEMLTGALPFGGRNVEEWVNCHLHIPVPSLDKSFPEDLNQLIQECTTKIAEERPPDFESVRKRLASAYSVITGRELPVAQASLPHSNQLMRKGIGLADLGESNAALSFFERSLRIDPDNAAAWLGKSYVLSRLGREDEALVCADRAVSLDPQDGKVWTGKALSLMRLGHHLEAMSCSERATSLAPKDWSIWPAKASILIALQKYEDAVAACDHALAIYPFAETLWYLKGQALHSLQQYEKALRCFDSALEIDPENSTANLYKGSILVDQHLYDQAIPFLDRCLASDPTSSKAWFCKGVAFAGLKKTKNEIDCLQRCVDIDPNLPNAWCNLSIALDEEGRFDEAFSCAQKAVAVGPDDTKALYNLGRILHKRGQCDESLVHLDHLLQIAPDYSMAWNEKGAVLTTMGRAQEAQEAFLFAAERGNEHAQLNLGRFYTEGHVTKDYGKALHWYTLAAENGSSKAKFSLALMYLCGQGVEQSPCQAYVWLQLAAEGGHAEAAVARDNVLELLRKNNVFKVDSRRPSAVAQAKHNLGVAYYHGTGTTQDYSKAFKCFKEAAKMGLADSRYNIGLMYKDGQGTNEDLVQAYFWLNLAALWGDNKAAVVRDSVAATMSAAQLATAEAMIHDRQKGP